MALSDALIALLRQARELNVARQFAAGAGLADVKQYIAGLFGGLRPEDIDLLASFGQQAFEAGRAIGRLEAGASLPVDQIPENVHIPEDFLEGGRGVIDVTVFSENNPAGRDVKIIITGNETLDDLAAMAEAQLQELWDISEPFRQVKVGDSYVEIATPGPLTALQISGATRGF